LNSKEQFQKTQKEACAWWSGIIGHPHWQVTMLYVRSAYLDTEPQHEQLLGAKRFEGILATISAAEEPAGEDVLAKAKPGIAHNLDVKRKTVQTAERPD